MEELEKAARAARVELANMRNIVRDEEFRVTRLIRHWFASDVREKENALRTVELKIAELKSARALAREGAPFPVGSKIRKRSYKGPSYAGNLVDVYAVVEAVTTDTKFPANRAFLPHPGSYIARILKSNGKPGANFIELDPKYEYECNKWKVCE